MIQSPSDARVRIADAEKDPNTGLSLFLEFVRDMCAIDPSVNHCEKVGPWWAGGEVEEYPDFRVIHRTDPSVSIVAKTEKGAALIRRVAEKRGIYIAPTGG